MAILKWVVFAIFFGLLMVVLTEIDASMAYSQLEKDVIIYEVFVEDEK